MTSIITATVVIGLVGLLVGIGLVYIGTKFRVEVDERESAVREVLPGNNCGACGYAGCDAMAAAIAAGEAPANGCPVGGAPVAEKIGKIMGVEAGGATRRVAFVRCNGTDEHTSKRNEYYGIKDCRALVLAGISTGNCAYGCVGLGSCADVCPQGAITFHGGAAAVNRERCIGCGLCAKACPKNLIQMVPYDQKVLVRCSNPEKGKGVKDNCDVGCIGCKLCTRQCESGAVTVDAALANIDFEKCINCGKCAEKCPQRSILSLL